VGPSVTIIDTGVAVTRQLSRVLAAQNLLNVDLIPGSEHFWTSGKVQTTQGVISTLWGHAVTVQRLPQTIA
jgi:glutamate racemase